jgi:hypothetical protein
LGGLLKYYEREAGMNSKQEHPIQAAGFWMFGFLSAVLAVLKLTVAGSYGQKTGRGHCPEEELVALRPLMIVQVWEVLC